MMKKKHISKTGQIDLVIKQGRERAVLGSRILK